MTEPRKFKTQAEIWQFLLIDGNKVIGTNGERIYFYSDGFLLNKIDGGLTSFRNSESFIDTSFWQEYIEPLWTDKLDGTIENGRWCWVSDIDEDCFKHDRLQLVFSFSNSGRFYISLSNRWAYAIPVTNEEFESMKQ